MKVSSHCEILRTLNFCAKASISRKFDRTYLRRRLLATPAVVACGNPRGRARAVSHTSYGRTHCSAGRSVARTHSFGTVDPRPALSYHSADRARSC